MKKALLLLTIIAAGTCANATPPFNPQAVTEFRTLQSQNIRDMQSMQEQRLKHEEYLRIKEEKQNKNRELENQDPAIKRIFNRKPVQQNVEFVQENGEIKIESSN